MGYAYYNIPTDNIAPNASVSVQSGIEDPEYLATQAVLLTDDQIGRPAKLTTLDGAWLFAYSAKQRVDFPVFWHNFDPDVTVRWQGNNSNAWGSPALDLAVSIPEQREDGYFIKPWLELPRLAGYDVLGFYYWRLVLSTPNSVPPGIKIWLGDKIRVLDRPIERGLHQIDKQSFIELPTASQFRWVYDLQGAPREYSGHINATPTTVTALRSWSRSSGARVHPSVLVPDRQINDAMIVRWKAQSGESALDFTFNNPGSRPIDVAWDEVTAGGPEWT